MYALKIISEYQTKYIVFHKNVRKISIEKCCQTGLQYRERNEQFVRK